jgi:alpha-tubulin suppressor-like RCC1 family protein
VKQVSISNGHACAIVGASGASETWCWGNGRTYQLGTGQQANLQYPTKVLGLTNPVQVAVASWGRGTTCALDSGRVRCWGGGSCGNKTDTACSSPVTVLTSTDVPLDKVAKVAGAENYGFQFCTLRTDHSIWCWGKANQTSAGNIGKTNVVALGDVAPHGPSFLTDDGVYHIGEKSVTPLCGAL